MIQPMNAFSAHVLFRGGSSAMMNSARQEAQRHIDFVNCTGVSAITGAVTTAMARSVTSSWRSAGFFGFIAAIATYFLVAHGFMHKSNSGITKQADKETIIKEVNMPKKLLPDVGDIASVAKNTTKATIKSMPKI